MIALRKHGQYLNMLPGTTVPWEVEDDMLDFDYVGQAFSYEFDIPRAGNEIFFNFAGAPETPRNGLHLYKDFQLTTDGTVFWNVTLILKRSTNKLYTIELTNIPSKLVENKSVKIAALINDAIPIADGKYVDIIAPINAANGNMIFPYTHFYGYKNSLEIMNLAPDAEDEPLSPLVPAFKLKYLLRSALATIGYQLADSYSTFGDDFDKIILISNRVINAVYAFIDPHWEYQFANVDNKITVADYLPEWQLLEFIRQVGYLTCSQIHIDDDRQIVEIRHFKRDANTTAYVDLTTKIDVEDVISEALDFTAFKLSYNTSNDSILQQMPDTAIGLYKGAYANEAAFNALGGEQEGDYAFCQHECAIFRWEGLHDGSGLLLTKYPPYQPHDPATKSDTLDIEIGLLPAVKDKYLYTEIEESLTIVNNGSGKVRITGFSQTSMPGTAYQIWFEETEKEKAYNQGWYDIILIDGAGFSFIDLDLTVGTSVKVNKVIGRRLVNYYLPVIGAGIHLPEFGYSNPSYSGRLALYHGMQPTIDGLATYPYASPDGIDAEGNPVGLLGLYIQYPGGLFENRFQDFEYFARTTRLLIMHNVTLSASELRALYLQKVARYAGGKFRLKKISANFGDDGPEDVEIEGYRI